MKAQKLIQCIVTATGLLLGVMLVNLAVAAAEEEQTFISEDVAKLLGWQSSDDNVCKGYFVEPQLLADNPNPLPISELPSQISSSGPTVFTRDGPSILQDDVQYTQPGRIATSDRAVIYRDPKTGRLLLIHLTGNVHMLEHGELVVGPWGNLNLGQGTATFGPSAYHILETPEHFHAFSQSYDAWGRAQQMHRHSDGIIDLYHATYSTCAPEKRPPWLIHAKHVRLNRETAVGEAYNATVRFKGVPLMYLPYYNFPLNSDRKSGLLMPDFSYDKRGGMGVSWPFYWNMAPNYDMLITPRVFSKRGVQLADFARYLNHRSYGEFYVSFIPDDAGFSKFRKDTQANPPGTGSNVQPFLDDLENDSDNRAFLSVTNHTAISSNWKLNVVGNYVTDDYYFKDFGNIYGDVNADQLLNQADIDYTGNHWTFMGMAQGFKTLHLIDNLGDDAKDQYTRLPELDLNGDYPDRWQGLDFQFSSQSVNFMYDSDYNPETDQRPIGERLHIMPSVSRPFHWVSGYVDPQVSFDSTSYFAQDKITGDETSRPDVENSRNLPIVDIDSGLYFQRSWNIGADGYVQTLEPRLFYLYVPYENQDQFPVFDTQLLNFSYDQLFSLNRFSSFDRLENANQVSIGLTSRFLDQATSFSKLQTDLGVIYYFQSPKVCLDPNNCQATYDSIPDDSEWSPVDGRITYNFLPHWSTSAEYAYNVAIGDTDNGKVQLSYHRDPKHILNFGYQYIETTGNLVDNFGLSNDTHYIYTGFAWPITSRLSGIAYGYYDISKERPKQYYAGLQYNSCCWAFRMLVQRNWISSTQDDGDISNDFDTVYTVQLELKSLGDFGTGKNTSLFKNTMGGFENPFIR